MMSQSDPFYPGGYTRLSRCVAVDGEGDRGGLMEIAATVRERSSRESIVHSTSFAHGTSFVPSASFVRSASFVHGASFVHSARAAA